MLNIVHLIDDKVHVRLLCFVLVYVSIEQIKANQNEDQELSFLLYYCKVNKVNEEYLVIVHYLK